MTYQVTYSWETALKGADIMREAGWAPVPYVQLTHE